MSQLISSAAQTIQCIEFFLIHFLTFVDIDGNKLVLNATIRLLTFASSDPKYRMSFMVMYYGELFKTKVASLCLGRLGHVTSLQNCFRHVRLQTVFRPFIQGHNLRIWF